MKSVIILCILFSYLFSSEPILEPIQSFNVSGGVLDIVYTKKYLYIATTNSSVDIVDRETLTCFYCVKVDKVKNFLGEMVDAKVYSVDILDNKLLLLSQASQGYRQVSIVENNITTKIISAKDALSIAKAKFLDANTLVFATLGSEIISYNIKEKRKLWTVQASGARFSDFVLNEKKDEIVVADESGNLKIIRSSDGKILEVLEAENLDNVFQVDYKNSIIATAGKDRRVVVYNQKNKSAYYKTSSFFIYSVGLSPSAKYVAYSSDEANSVTLFNRATKKTIALLKGNKMRISNIVFLNEKTLLIASDNEIINLYQIK